MLVKPPLAADEIQPEDIEKLAVSETVELEPEPQSSQWQIIDTLPTLTENTSNKTVHEFLDQLKDAHKQRIDRHLNDSSNT